MDWNWTEQPSVGPVINLLSQRKPLKSDIDFKNMWNTRSYLAEDTLVQDHTVYGNCEGLHREAYEHIDTLCDVS